MRLRDRARSLGHHRFSVPTAVSIVALLAFVMAPSRGNAEAHLRAELSTLAASHATAVSGPILDIQPAVIEFGIVNVGASETRDYTVRNIGDADLEISELFLPEPQFTTDHPLPVTLAPGSSLVATATFTPTGGSADATIEVRSNATNSPYTVIWNGQGNHTPVIDPIEPVPAIAWIPLQLTAHASDLDGDPVTLSADGLPPGAAFDGGSGMLSWTPTADDGGAHTVTITAFDGHASSSIPVTITVTVLNRPPVADAGGAYAAVVGTSVTFDGSSSHDPEGQTLAFHWTFGDGVTGSGERPVHVYGATGVYPVTLEVIDDGVPPLRDTASTLVTVSNPAGFSEVTLPAVQDNTIYSESDSSFGQGWCLQVGRPTTTRGPLRLRRALVRFDLNSIPAGSRIVSARLNLYRFELGGPGTSMRVYRVLQEWGEGGSGEGDDCAPPPRVFGRAPTESSSTWNYRLYGAGAIWQSETGVPLPGGSFRSSFSDSEYVDRINPSVGLTSEGLSADVTDWVRDPVSNHGWILIGDEENPGSGMRFASRQVPDPAHAPSITIFFTPATGACCKPDGTCDPMLQSECEALSGRYGGNGSTCEEQVCLEPYVDWLPLPSVAKPVRGRAGDEAYYEIAMKEFRQKLHRDLPPTTLWGYAGQYPGPTIEATRNRPVQVRWINDLRDVETGLPRTSHYFDVDTRIHGPDMAGKTPRTVVHLHGGNVPSAFDGFPESTFVSGESRLYRYPNSQPATTLWYHDHALGITRYNVMMGLAGFYLIRDREEEALHLPSGPSEIPLVIQDRSFHPDGSLEYPAEWMPMFFGDKVLVNGKVWPKLRVDRGKYRLRVLNGSNHRMFTLALSDRRRFHVVGSDGGLLTAPVEVTRITLAPAERADLVLDFTGDAPGSEVLLQDTLEENQMDASDPFASRIMKLVVSETPGWTSPLPTSLKRVEPIAESRVDRARTFELRFDRIRQQFRFGDFGWGEATEFPVLGSTEIWQFANETPETHPIHIHLVQFQVLDRSSFEVVDGVVVPGSDRRPPDPEEAGWKDTAKVKPHELLRVIMRFAPNGYMGDYVFHCHMLEHEDNDMMRQFTVVPPGALKPTVPSTSSSLPGTEVRYTTSLGWSRMEGPSAVVSYTLAEQGAVTLAIYDVAGRRVASLADAVRERGSHRSVLKLPHVARGIYFVRMHAGGKVFTRRMPVLQAK